MGIRYGRHLGISIIGVYGNREQQDSRHTVAHHSKSCAPGTTVWSDQWSSYGTVGSLPNVSTVNHSVTFVAPSGIHTQNIESYWNSVKIKFKRMRDCRADQLPSYLDEFVYRERYGITCRQMFNSI